MRLKYRRCAATGTCLATYRLLSDDANPCPDAERGQPADARGHPRLIPELMRDGTSKNAMPKMIAIITHGKAFSVACSDVASIANGPTTVLSAFLTPWATITGHSLRVE